MNYDDNCRFLELPQKPNTYLFERSPPVFICNEKETQNSLKRIFSFTDKFFEKHFIEYGYHQIENFIVNPSRNITVIELRFKWNHNYFHFLTEGLPSLLEIKSQVNIEDFTLLCVQSNFIQNVLKWFEINNNVSFNNNSDLKDIYVMKKIECGNPSPQKIKLLRNEISKKLIFEKKYGILIKRSESYRSIMNHDQLLENLKNFYSDIEWKVFDKLSFNETTELFSKAKIIFAPHGAGLTNMLFSPNNITIIEIMNKDDPNVCYWHLSQTLQNNHYIIPIDTFNGNFVVDDRFKSIKLN
jgi:hypothetical protein